MTPEEARTLAGFLKGAFPSLTDEQVEIYESSLLFDDATLASKAILEGIREWKFAPKYADIVERIRSMRREAPRPAPTPEEVADFSRPIPFWVRRWVVARFVCSPPDMRPFPEQYVDSQGQLPIGEEVWMPEGEHEAQAKKVTDDQVRAAVRKLSHAELLAGP